MSYAAMTENGGRFGNMPGSECTFSSDEDEDGLLTGTGSDSEGGGILDQLMDDNTGWGKGFQMTTAAVILSCTFSMAIETDYCPDCSFWWWWNSAILVYFCSELFVRIRHAKFDFFACWGDNVFWNYFDTTIVVICVATLWVEPLIATETGGQGFEILRIFRVFRILRTLRVLRIFKACDQLNKLASGLLESIVTVFWIALLMFMVMLIFAIILTDVAGNQAAVAVRSGDLFYDNRAEIDKYWGSVGRSLVTLFQMLTLDDWTNISRMVYLQIPAMWFVFFMYIFTMGFAMLSLLTGVVAEHMTEVSTNSKAEEKKEGDEELRQFLEEEMPRVYRNLNQDSTPPNMATQEMTKETFKLFLRRKEVQQQLEDLNASLGEHEVDEFWDCLERNNDGMLSLAELKAGFLRLRGELQPKDMLRIRYAAERVARTLQGGQGEAATTRKLEEINLDLEEVDNKLTEMQSHLRGFMDFAQQSCSKQALRRVTNNVSTACTCS